MDKAAAAKDDPPVPDRDVQFRVNGRVRKLAPVLWAIFAITLTTRLAHLAWLGKEAGMEEHLHEPYVIAENLLSGNGYSLSSVSPTAHKPPVYPLFLALMSGVFGSHAFLAIRVVQSFVFAAAMSVGFALFRYLVSDRLALAVTVLCVASPFLRKTHVWIELAPFAIAGTLLLLLLAIRARCDPARAERFVLLGIVNGILALTLATTLCFVPVIGLWVFFQLPRQVRFGRTCLYALGLMAALAPWTVRNAVVFGRFIPVSSNLKLELWIGNNPDATGGMQNAQREPMTQPHGELAKRVDRLPEVERNDALGREAFSYIAEHPGRFALLRAKAFFYFFCTQSYWLEPDHSAGRVLAKFLVVLQAVLAMVGCMAALRRHVPYAGLLAGCLGAYTSVYTLTHADVGDRYRLPIDPLLIFFAVYAVTALRACLRARASRAHNGPS